MPGWKLYDVPGYDEPLRLSPEHAEDLGGTEIDEPTGTTTAPSKTATKAEWAQYAKAQGMDPAAADAATRKELIDQYGG